MEFKQLEAFVAVVDYGSFSEAARKLYLTQPTISAHVRSLEEELHTKLIIRTTKKTTITTKGYQLYDSAVRMLEIRNNLLENFTGVQKHMIDLAASTIPSSYLLPEILAAYGKTHPDTYFHSIQGDARENHRQQAPQPQSRQNLPDHVGGGPLQPEEVRVKVPAQIGGAQPQHKAVEGHVKQVGQVGRAACKKKRGQIDQQEHCMVRQAVFWQCFHIPLPPQIAGLRQNFVDLRQRIRRTGINQRVTPEQHQIVHAVRHYGEHLAAA